MQNPSDLAAHTDLTVPTREEAYTQALHHMAITFQNNENIWIVHEHYDEHEIGWAIDVVRRGSMDRWVRQRYRYDAQPQTLHFLGERIISTQELNQSRHAAKLFSVNKQK